MVKFFLAIVALVIILIIFQNSKKNKYGKKSDIYKILIFILIIGAIIFFLSTSGKFIFPQIFQLLKIGIPFLTKFIGI